MNQDNFEEEVIKNSMKLDFYLTYKDLTSALPNKVKKKDKEAYDEALNKSKELIKKKSIIEILCPSLKSFSGDLKEAAKIVTAALLPLSLLATPIVPLNPLIYGGIAVVVIRAGINSICPSEDNKKED